MRQVAASAVLSYIWPNELVISLGDRLLRRDGAIMAAVDDWKDNQGNLSQDW
jgi:predicted protein tyrosine phosphatase